MRKIPYGKLKANIVMPLLKGDGAVCSLCLSFCLFCFAFCALTFSFSWTNVLKFLHNLLLAKIFARAKKLVVYLRYYLVKLTEKLNIS